MRGAPPRWASLLLAWVLPAERRAEVLGDLEEMFERRERVEGRGRATIWYLGQAATTPLWLWTEEAGDMVTHTLGEVRYAVRAFLRSPGFTITTVGTLALGIGAVAAVFSVVNGVLLQPLAYPEPDRVVSVTYTAPGLDLDVIPSSVGTYMMARESSRTLSDVGLYTSYDMNLTGEGAPQRLPVIGFTPSSFRVLGLEPRMGRVFTEEEGLPDGGRVVLVSNALWVGTFGSDPGIVGRTVQLNGIAREVVGVLPPGLDYPLRDAQAVVPLRVDPAATHFGGFNQMGIARLAPGATPEAAKAELASQLLPMTERFEGLDPGMLETARLSPVVQPLSALVVGDVRSALWILMGTVGFVLLIACGNVANLLLVRAEGRQKEMAIRSALGADRKTLFGRSLAESGLLAGAGAVGGLALAAAGIAALKRTAPSGLPRLEHVSLDPAVVGVTTLTAVAVAVLFGLVPLARIRAVSATLRDGGRGATGGRGRHRARQLLVAGQVALALVLLAGSGLMVRSFRALLNVDPGFQAADVTLFELAMSGDDYAESADVAAFHQRFLDRLAVLPGVEAVGLVTRPPLHGLFGVDPILVRGRTVEPSDIPPLLTKRVVTPGYFDVMGIPLLDGRGLTSADVVDRTGAVLVSARAAELYWPDQPALGQETGGFGIEQQAWNRVVGIVGDVPYTSLTEPPMGAIYYPLLRPEGGESLDWLSTSVTYTIRSTLSSEALAGPIRAALAELDPRLPIANLTTMDAQMRRSRAQMAFTMSMLALSALMGLVLGVVGLYGVISYVTARRTREIGVRMALGAATASVRSMVLKQGMGVVALGVGVGLVASVALTRLMRSVLYEVTATDPVTLAAVTVLLVAVSGAALWLPARRAAGVDPVRALRAE